MEKFSKIMCFVSENRRTIGVIIGAVMTLLGMGDFTNTAVSLAKRPLCSDVEEISVSAPSTSTN